MNTIKRLTTDIETLRAISDPCDGGVTRISFTPAYRKGVQYIQQRMQETGLRVFEDEIGNLHGVLEGANPAAPRIISGSHLDTVRNAGAFDGIAGVVCALEAARLLKERQITLQHSYEIVAFIEEEGTRFGQFLLGSRFISGELTDADKDRIQDQKGETLRSVLASYMGVVQAEPAYRKGDEILAFLEVHGEQGPVLEQTKTDIGIVQSIVALAQLTVTITGFAGHAGTVPMLMRQDAGLAACKLICGISDFAQKQYPQEATVTVGMLQLHPNSSNCIPGQCVFSIDVRSGIKENITAILQHIEKLQQQVQQECNVTIVVNKHTTKDSVVMDANLQAIIAQSCAALQLSHRPINSGAGHDAMVMANICPTAMVFIPCEKGITHHPLEHIETAAMKNGAELLLESIIALDRQSI